MQRPSTIERAFILADEGACRTIADLRVKLKREGMEAVDAHLAGSSVQQQLKKRMAAIKPAEETIVVEMRA